MFRFIQHHWRRRFERFYRDNYWHLIIDISLGLIILILVIIIIIFSTFRPNSVNISGKPIYHQPAVDINNPPIQLEFVKTSNFFYFNQPVVLKININNPGSLNVADINLNFFSSNKELSISQIKLASSTFSLVPDSVKVSDQKIIIKEIKAQEKQTLSLEIYFSGSNDISQRTLTWGILAEYSLGTQIIKQTFVLEPLKLASELRVKAAAYYNSPQGDQLGIGPIPPLVGLTTSYWIFWEARSLGDFRNLVFSARLPQGVELTPKQAILAGNFNYNPESRQLIWKLEKIDHQQDSYRASFEVQLTPTVKQLGQILPLISNLKYYAEDLVSGVESTGELPNLDTNLLADRLNQNQGQVAD